MQIIQKEIEEFISSFNHVIIASVDEKAIPLASYAPFVKFENDFFIYISKIAPHTKNILKHRISIMFLQNQTCDDILTKKRITFLANTTEIRRDDVIFNKVMNIFIDKSKNNQYMNIIAQMKDFILVKIEPISGRFVKGFGQAYQIKDNKITHIKL